MAVLPIGISGEEGGYQIERSLRFNSADSAYLSRTPASAGNRKTWTWSGWVKRSALGSGSLFSAYIGSGSTDNEYFDFYFDGDTQIQCTGWGTVYFKTTQVFRDISSWYHVMCVVDTSSATANNRVRLYINGSEVTTFSTRINPTQNADLGINQSALHTIGRSTGFSAYQNGYLTEVNFIDGQALDPTSFGETDSTTGVWKPKAYAGTYGTNGFYLNFSDNSGTTATTLGKDYSGNSNNWTPNNFSVTAGAGNDSMVDVPTLYGTDTGAGAEVRGNYCTWNPLVKTGTVTHSNGNLTAAFNGWATGSIAMPSSGGKYYFEVKYDATSSSADMGVGLINQDNGTHVFADGIGYYTSGGKYVEGSGSAYGASWGVGDVVGVAVNMDAGEVTFYKNGASQGAISLTAGKSGWLANASNGALGQTQTATINAGQRPFAYAAPSGFKALCTTNLPDPAIADGSTAMNVVTYTGNGSTQSITGVGFQPDWVWVKKRSAAGTHQLVDAVRGNTKYLFSNQTYSEETVTNAVTSFDSDGFSLGANTGGGTVENNVNQSTATYVAWNWKAGGSGVSNTDGSITSTVSANPTAGFSIVTYTGNSTTNATVGHGLGVAPSMVIIKNRSAVQNWGVAHSSLAANNLLLLDTTSASVSAGTRLIIGNSSTFSVGDAADYGVTNQTGQNYVAYCFAPVSGYSAFGSYTGNGSTDGPFVFLNFKPKFWMTKRTDSTSSWLIVDGERNTYNVVDKYLVPNTSNAEGAATVVDFTSNGVKFRGTTHNDSGGTFIYAAFAENPFKHSLAR